MHLSRNWIRYGAVLGIVLAIGIMLAPSRLMSMSRAKAADQVDESWVDKPGSGVEGKAIFTDCRVKMGDGRGHPVPMMKTQHMPSPAGGRSLMMESAPAASTPPPPSPRQEKRADSPPAEPKKEEAPGQQDNSIYLSNDDSMSLSSAQRIEYAIRHFLPVPAAHLRPHEFLNYYRFDHAPIKDKEIFSVLAETTPGLMRDQTSLALSISGRHITKEERRSAVITFIVDQSGSMKSANKMSYTLRGLKRVYDELKKGDVINIVQFNQQVCTPLEGFVYGRDNKDLFEKAVDNIQALGSTNLHDGLVSGYDLANKYYEGKKNNRVIMLTDAIANTGLVNEQLSSTVTRHYDKHQIAFSGIGVGHDFNDSMLNQLTERGKGAYLFLSSESAVGKVFGSKFVSLLEVVARNVHFKLVLPDSLKMDVFYGEESSTKKEEVQAIHYFANTSQLFLSDLKGEAKAEDRIALEIEYTDPASGKAGLAKFQWSTGEIFKKNSKMIAKSRLVLSLTDLIGETAAQTCPWWRCYVHPCFKHRLPPPPPDWRPYRGYGVDVERGMKTCAHYKQKMEELAIGLSGDPEVEHLMNLRSQYCDRFDVKRDQKPPALR